MNFADEDDVKEKFPKYNYESMEMMCDMIGDKENDVKKHIEDIASEFNIKKICDGIINYSSSNFLSSIGSVNYNTSHFTQYMI